MNTKNKAKTYIYFHYEPGEVEVSWGYTIFTKKTESGKYACFIPGFRIHFSVTSLENIKDRGRFLTRMFLDYYLGDPKKGSSSLGLELHRKGFVGQNGDLSVSQMLNKKKVNQKFKPLSEVIPAEFENTTPEEFEEKMAIAV